ARIQATSRLSPKIYSFWLSKRQDHSLIRLKIGLTHLFDHILYKGAQAVLLTYKPAHIITFVHLYKIWVPPPLLLFYPANSMPPENPLLLPHGYRVDVCVTIESFQSAFSTSPQT